MATEQRKFDPQGLRKRAQQAIDGYRYSKEDGDFQIQLIDPKHILTLLDAFEQSTRALAESAKCSTCCGDPKSHASGKLCVCGDGTRNGEVQGLREALFNETERAAESEAIRETYAVRDTMTVGIISGLNEKLAESEEARGVLVKALEEIVDCGVQEIDPRLNYVEMQIDRLSWKQAQEALAAPTPASGAVPK